MECQFELSAQPLAERTISAEAANSLTHGLGLLMSLFGAGLLLRTAAESGPYWLVGGCLVYSACLVAVYGASTLSHLAAPGEWRDWFRKIDQAAIYLLIAGTYTPVALAYLCHDGWWLLLTAMWILAAAGFCSKLLWAHRVNCISTVTYVLLGWLPIMGIVEGLHLIPAPALWWALAGGLCYTVGVLFLINDHRYPYLHTVWHLCVIAGSCCHFYVVLQYVVGSAVMA